MLDGQSYQINGQCYTSILMAYKHTVDDFMVSYPRVFLCQLILRPPSYTDNNRLLSKHLLPNLIKHLKRQYKTKSIGYAWVREVSKQDNLHYHLCLLMDGEIISNSYKLIKLVTEFCGEHRWGWKKPALQCDPFKSVNRPYYNLDKQDSEFNQHYRAMLYHLSYHAKTRDKGRRSKTSNDHSVSKKIGSQR